MAIGVSMQRLCPDQSGYEAARKAAVDKALYVPPVEKPKAVYAPKSAIGGVHREGKVNPMWLDTEDWNRRHGVK